MKISLDEIFNENISKMNDVLHENGFSVDDTYYDETDSGMIIVEHKNKNKKA